MRVSNKIILSLLLFPSVNGGSRQGSGKDADDAMVPCASPDVKENEREGEKSEGSVTSERRLSDGQLPSPLLVKIADLGNACWVVSHYHNYHFHYYSQLYLLHNVILFSPFTTASPLRTDSTHILQHEEYLLRHITAWPWWADTLRSNLSLYGFSYVHAFCV